MIPSIAWRCSGVISAAVLELGGGTTRSAQASTGAMYGARSCMAIVLLYGMDRPTAISASSPLRLPSLRYAPPRHGYSRHGYKRLSSSATAPWRGGPAVGRPFSFRRRALPRPTLKRPYRSDCRARRLSPANASLGFPCPPRCAKHLSDRRLPACFVSDHSTPHRLGRAIRAAMLHSERGERHPRRAGPRPQYAHSRTASVL